MADSDKTNVVESLNHNSTWSRTAKILGEDVVSSLPPAFLLLILINCVFIGLVLWFIAHEQDVRTTIMKNIIDHCLAR